MSNYMIIFNIFFLITCIRNVQCTNDDSFSVLHRWCEVELLLTRLLTLQIIIWTIAISESENPNSSQVFPNHIKSEGNDNSLVKESVKSITVSLNFHWVSFVTFCIRSIKVCSCKDSSTSLLGCAFKETFFNDLLIIKTRNLMFQLPVKMCYMWKIWYVVRLHQFTIFFLEVTDVNKKFWGVIY